MSLSLEEPTAMSIHWSILRSLVRHPTRVFVVDDSRSYRGVDILIAALHVSDQIRASCASDCVGVMLPTSGAFPIAALAGWMAGKIVVPLNYLLKKDELQYVVDDCGADTIVTAGAMLEFLKASAGVSGGGVGGGGVPTINRLIQMDQLDFRSVPDVRWPAQVSDEELAVMLYTSGTSGRPKGVMLTHANILANIRQIQGWVDLRDGDCALGVLPQFHSFGMTVLTLLPLVHPFKAVYTARFVPNRIIKLFREHKPTMFVGIPSMYNALLHAKDVRAEDFASCKYLVSGGEPLPKPVFDGFRERFGVTINEGYGLTETSPVSNWCRPNEWRAGSVGKPLPWIEQRIVDIETGRTLPNEHDGEVRMRGPNVMRGYYKLDDETRKAFDDQGFFRTGDIGRFDADGHLHITGRLKEMLIVAGENVFPREIEEVLSAHPKVKDSGVVGKPDPMRGELPLAFVEMKDTPDAPGQKAEFDERELKTWCRQRLAGYKVPDEIRVVEALPRNATGKVMRRELKRLA